MTAKSRHSTYGASARAAHERAKGAARKEADRLAVRRGPAQPSPTLRDALNAGYPYLGAASVAIRALRSLVRRPKTTPIHELERYTRGKNFAGAGQAEPLGSPAATEASNPRPLAG